MAEKIIDGETYRYSLADDFVKRGPYYAGPLSDGIAVYYGSEHGYPMGDTVLRGLKPEQLAGLIAILRAAQDKYYGR